MWWADFQGFAAPVPLAEYAVAHRKGFTKPLKMRPRPLNAIDVVLKRMPVTGNGAWGVVYCDQRAVRGPLRPCSRP